MIWIWDWGFGIDDLCPRSTGARRCPDSPNRATLNSQVALTHRVTLRIPTRCESLHFANQYAMKTYRCRECGCEPNGRPSRMRVRSVNGRRGLRVKRTPPPLPDTPPPAAASSRPVFGMAAFRLPVYRQARPKPPPVQRRRHAVGAASQLAFHLAAEDAAVRPNGFRPRRPSRRGPMTHSGRHGSSGRTRSSRPDDEARPMRHGGRRCFGTNLSLPAVTAGALAKRTECRVAGNVVGSHVPGPLCCLPMAHSVLTRRWASACGDSRRETSLRPGSVGEPSLRRSSTPRAAWVSA